MTSFWMVLATVGCMFFGFGCGQKQQSVEMFPKEEQATQAAGEVAAISVPAVTSQAPSQPQAATVVSPTPISTTNTTAQSTSSLPTEPTERTKMVQTALRNLNLYTGAIDGKMGPLTEQAIRSFQSAHNLKVDGKVGPLTWTELSKYLSSPDASSSGGAQQ